MGFSFFFFFIRPAVSLPPFSTLPPPLPPPPLRLPRCWPAGQMGSTYSNLVRFPSDCKGTQEKKKEKKKRRKNSMELFLFLSYADLHAGVGSVTNWLCASRAVEALKSRVK